MSDKNDLNEHLKNREWMVASLAGEIFGPGGKYAEWKNDLYKDCATLTPIDGMTFETWEDYQKRHTDSVTGEEILKEESPSRRYGVGLLYPEEPETRINDSNDEQAEAEEASRGITKDHPGTETLITEEEKKALRRASKFDRIPEASSDVEVEADEEEDPLSFARLRKPRSMGVTFVADLASGALKITLEGARYKTINVFIKNKSGRKSSKSIYPRIPIHGSVELKLHTDFVSPKKVPVKFEPERIPGLQDLEIHFDVRVRDIPAYVKQNSILPESARMITVTLINDSYLKLGLTAESLTLFQSRFHIEPLETKKPTLLPLPQARKSSDDEEESLALLYKNSRVYATGHGCAGDWEADENKVYAKKIIAEPMPCYETPPVTPDLKYPKGHEKEGENINIQMLPLARAESGWITPLQDLLEAYSSWIDIRNGEIDTLPNHLQNTATKHLSEASKCYSRMHEGLELLKRDEDAALAFKLTNEVIMLQQIAGSFGQRTRTYDKALKKWVVETEYQAPSLDHKTERPPAWRPFQIAFLLMSLPGLWDGKHPDREIADLIWFPTGGGKTEAYLGASAFVLLTRRLRDDLDSGTAVLMRYTLRLLTSQQFQRASGLICALESIRKRESSRLGSSPYSIGIWVGSGTTPNSRSQSIEAYNRVKKDGHDAYQHVMLRCPWCGAHMGPIKKGWDYECPGTAPSGSGASRYIRIFCPDSACDFHDELPIKVVDEDIYDTPPSLVIGTVDKFAMLAWRPEARSLFGISRDGDREHTPPELIIQDELHLITGPLGSIVGLYEGVIEELCTDYRYGSSIKAKLVASTATTRASTRQIKDLYARPRTAIFPPPGLDASDSFFATYDRDDDGRIKPGRLYLGVLARNYSSTLTVSVRVFSTLLAASSLIADVKKRDPWHTLLVFYNSLRELGANLTLFGADIPERLSDLKSRWTPSPKDQRRYLNRVLELTGRLSNSEIPLALESLEKSTKTRGTIDACLASNIIEVGVDVPRLGVMAVSGQPKNTAQYIQATGRVGRKSPGLVVMLYDAAKSRDLSHYEHFKDYHECLYAAVEPSSVTPFTERVLERAAHGAFLAWIRNLVAKNAQDDPRAFTDESNSMRIEIQRFYAAFKQRIELLYSEDPEAGKHAQSIFKFIMNRRTDQWLTWTAANSVVRWEDKKKDSDSGDIPLLRFYGQACNTERKPRSWQTPTSMRGVDAECRAEICVADTNASTDEPTTTTGLFD